MEIYEAPDNSKFYLSDSPVLINDIDGIDYLLPISPKFAVVMKRFSEVNSYCMSILQQPTENMMYCINNLFVKNANWTIIVSDMSAEDEEFIIKALKEKEAKSVEIVDRDS